jgi:hypothetical protein
MRASEYDKLLTRGASNLMKAIAIVVLALVAGFGWLLAGEAGSLFLFGTALTGIGMLARRMRSARGERA